MFQTDSERVIPRQKARIGSFIIQVFLVLFIIFFFGLMILDDFIVDWLKFDAISLILLFVIFFAITGLISLVRHWNQGRKWNLFADEMGFQIEQPSLFAFPVIKGTFRAHQISIERSSERRGRNRVYFTNFTINLNTPTTNSFTIQKYSLIHLNRTKTRDAEIDKKLTVKISSDKLLQQILKTRRVRQGLLELGGRARVRTLTLKGTILHYKESGQISDLEYMRAVLSYLVELTNLVERVEEIGF